MFSDSAIALIGTYQRYISPHKGFSCAYRASSDRPSCSAFAQRVIRRFGLLEGLLLLRLRFAACSASAAVLSESKPNEKVKNDACPLFSKEGAGCVGGAAASELALGLEVVDCLGASPQRS